MTNLNISSERAASLLEKNEQKTDRQSVSDKDKSYSIFDNVPQDGIVSVDEQKAEFLRTINQNNKIVEVCKQLKMNLLDFFNNFAGHFTKIDTDGTKESAENADRIVRLRVLEFRNKLCETLLKKFEGKEEQPPSITTKDGLVSDDCMDYLISKFVNMGLDLDTDTLVDVFARYDYALSGEDSIISPNELYNKDYTSKYMNHDFDGNIKDTHALDYLANVYAAALKNK